MGSKLYRKFKTPDEKRAFYLMKNFKKAINDFKMIEKNDRVLIGLSGGKDSVTLFKLLIMYKKMFYQDFEIIPMIILSELQEAIKKNIPALEEFVKKEGYELIVKEIKIDLTNPDARKKSLCFLCSWHRRKHLFLATRDYRCNKLALGHHADDIAETTLLNLFYHGRLERMEPKMDFFDGEFTLIRPLAYINEKEIINYTNKLDVKLFTCSCPHGDKTKRFFLKNILHQIEKEIPKVKINLFRAAGNHSEFIPIRVKRKRKNFFD